MTKLFGVKSEFCNSETKLAYRPSLGYLQVSSNPITYLNITPAIYLRQSILAFVL